MMQAEFEQLTKSQVTAEEYANIERIYMAAPDAWKKVAFCRAYKAANKDVRDLLFDMTQTIESLTIKKQNAEHDAEMAKESAYEHKNALDMATFANKDIIAERDVAIAQKESLAIELLQAGLDQKAISILGHPCVVRLKCKYDIELSKADKELIAEFLTK